MSSSAYALIWQRLFQCCKQMPTRRILFFYGISLAILGGYGWGLYVPFLEGRLPGWHWAAFVYQIVFPWLEVFLLAGVLLGGWIILAIATLVLFIISFWQPRRRAQAGYFCCIGILWFLSIVAFLPALSHTYSDHQVLAIEPWRQIYRTAYIASWFEEFYGDTMVSECNSLGWCHQIYRDYTEMLASSQQVKMFYDQNTDRMKVESDFWVYMRSQEQQLCPTDSFESWDCIQLYSE